MDGLTRCAAAAALLALAPLPAAGQDSEVAQRLARELQPAVERAVGLPFRRPPAVAVRSRDQLRSYLTRKLAQEMPPQELRAVERAYRAFQLMPAASDLRRLMLDLYTEQVAGFYDPDSSTLFVVRGGDPAMLRLVMAHELVHALQDQYMRLNDIMKLRRQNDRQMAGHAVAEGQATLASLVALAPGASLPDLTAMWATVREGIRRQQSAMPVFAGAPRIVQEGLIFPYLAGADFMRSFEDRKAREDEQPYGERLPVTTEQILHPSKYTSRELPARLTIASLPGDTAVYDDDFGEFETRVVLESWGVAEAEATAAAAGWNGDRYAVRGSAAGTVLIWVTAWDTGADAAEFERTLRAGWARTAARRSDAGSRRWLVDRMARSGVEIVRLVDAPAGWRGWGRLPGVSLSR